MTKQARFYLNGILGKHGPYTCKVLFKLGPFRVIRFATYWDHNTTTYKTRIKLYWNIEEVA
jgi:hypothetical protein